MTLFPIRWRRDYERELLPAFGTMENLLDRTWGSFFRNNPDLAEGWLPALDVTEDEKAIVVKVEVPGIDKNDLKVNLENGILTISGEKKEEKEEKGKYYRLERRYGSFTRRVDLAAEVKGDKVEAHYDKGLLTVTLPKAEEEAAKRTNIKVQ